MRLLSQSTRNHFRTSTLLVAAMALTLTAVVPALAHHDGGSEPSVDDGNDPSWWQTHFADGSTCTKPFEAPEGQEVDSYTVPTPPTGYKWSWLVVNAGQPGPERNTIVEDPVVGQAYDNDQTDDVSNVILCKVPTDTLTLVKVWQDGQGAPVQDPGDITWQAQLVTNGDSDTITLDQATNPTGSVDTTDTSYDVTEDDSSADFDEVDCSQATRDRINTGIGTGKTTYFDGSGTGFQQDGDTVHVICNTETSTPPPPPGTWDLTVDKSVLDFRNDPVAEDFEFTVVCGDGTNEILEFTGEGSATVTGIDDGAECTVTETVDGGADETSAAIGDAELVAFEGDEPLVVDLESSSSDVTVNFLNTFSEVLEEILDPDASIAGDCGGVVVDLDNTGSTTALDFVVDINGTEQTLNVPAGGTDQVTAPLRTDDSWDATVTVNDNVVASGSGQEDCSVEPIVEPTARVDADCDGVEVTLDNTGSEAAVEYTVVINGESQQVTVPGGATRTVTGELDDEDAHDVTVSADGMATVTAQDDLNCPAVKGVVLEKPAPDVEAEQLAVTGSDHVRLLGLSMMVAVLGAMMVLATTDGRRRRSTS